MGFRNKHTTDLRAVQCPTPLSNTSFSLTTRDTEICNPPSRTPPPPSENTLIITLKRAHPPAARELLESFPVGFFRSGRPKRCTPTNPTHTEGERREPLPPRRTPA